MNRSIEQALLSLLPTHNDALPQPLTELASSLLAQSRHRASTLKAEEEIARPYACAHLACERLKTTLNLPPIDPRPPIPPRIYKRLYSHLEKILPTAASTPSRGTPGRTTTTTLGSGRVRTPSSKLRQGHQQQQDSPSPLANKSKSRPTPSKATSLSQFSTTPTKHKSPAAAAAARNGRSHDPLPRWIRPTLRFLTARLGPAHIGPVVASGLESIITPRGKLTDDAWVLANLVPVLAAVYLYVWRGVTWPGRAMDQAVYVKFRKDLAGTLAQARGHVKLPEVEGGEEEDGWKGWKDGVGVKEFDTAALRGNRHGWFDMDWVMGVHDLVMREMDAEDGEGGQEEEDEEQEVVVGQARLPDTMFQERYDYLSERKRKAYADWKEGVLKRIRELEKGS